MKNLMTFESFLDDIDYQKYLYIVEDILILEEVTAGSVDNPNSKAAKMIKKKSKTIMEQVDDIEKEIDEDKYESFKEKIDKVWKKIKDLRKSGLESESGEFSIGNLVFKLLRRNGYIGKIMDLKKYAYEKQFK